MKRIRGVDDTIGDSVRGEAVEEDRAVRWWKWSGPVLSGDSEFLNE